MGFWQQVQITAGMGGSYHWVLLGCVAVIFTLSAITPQAHARLRAAALLIVGSFVAMLICGFMIHHRALDSSAAGYRYVHFASQLLFSIAIVNLAGILLFRVILAPIHFEPAPILRDTLLGLSYVVVALTLLSRHGVDLSGIVATSAVVTAVIGFSLQDTLGNVMGGVALQMEQSIGVGDWIRIGEIEGLVREIRWRQTSVETRNWDTVVIPNSVLMKSQVTVLGRRAGKPKLHRMWVEFNVDFRHAPVDVIDTVEQALHADTIPNIATDPPANCIFNDFKESYGRYAVRYWLIDLHQDAPTSSEVRTRIFVALKRAGIGLSMPAQSVFLTMESKTRELRKQQEELNRRAATLNGVLILQPLTDAERLRVAEGLNVAPFRKGEVITRQGNEAHYLYIIVKGEAEVRIVAGEGQSRAVARLGKGQVFGEMGLMTGEPRTATVIALTDTVCYRLDKDTFKEALERRPEIAEAISHLLAKRKLELDELTHGLDTEAMRHRIGHTQEDLLQRIRRFFILG